MLKSNINVARVHGAEMPNVFCVHGRYTYIYITEFLGERVTRAKMEQENKIDDWKEK